MSTQIKRARDGYVYRITYVGRQIKSIRDKFIDCPQGRYKKQVPKSWVTNGYVEEVKDDDNADD